MFAISRRRIGRTSFVVAALAPFAACLVPRAASTVSNQKLAGTWAFVAHSGPSDGVVGTLTIVNHARGLAGAIRMNLLDTVSTNVRIDVKGAQISFAAPTRAVSSAARPQDQFFSVVATPNADHTMTGLWNRDGRGGQWTAKLIDAQGK